MGPTHQFLPLQQHDRSKVGIHIHTNSKVYAIGEEWNKIDFLCECVCAYKRKRQLTLSSQEREKSLLLREGCRGPWVLTVAFVL